MPYDVQRIRAGFPSLGSGTTFFDAPGGTQTPTSVARAVADTMTSAISNRGPGGSSARRADEVVREARSALGDLLGTEPDGVVLGRSMTALTYDLARTLAAGWGPGDEVVVTALDHDANIRPWVQAARSVGASVRWAEFDPRTGELPVAAVEEVLSPRTVLVAVTGAANLIGTRPDIPAVTAAAHAVGALVHLDAVHLTPHSVIDRQAWGVDVLACSPYKFYGPHLGVQAAAPELLRRLHPLKLLPSPDGVPERFELGTLPYELLAGTTAAVEVLAGLAPREGGDRRARLASSMAAAGAHEKTLQARLEQGLAAIDGSRTYSRAAQRTPTVLFSVDGVDSQELTAFLAAAGVAAPCGHFYAIEASRRLGLGERGAIRAGIAAYTHEQEVDTLLDGVTRGVSALRR